MIKKILFASMMLAVLTTACNKEENTSTFTASMEKCTNQNGSKAQINGKIVEWQLNDNISLFNEGSARYTLKVTDVTEGEASLDMTADDPSTPFSTAFGNFYGVYPSTAAASRTTMFVPSEENVVKNGSGSGTTTKTMPMMCKTSAKSGHLVFKNMCGILKIHLSKPGVQINQIDFSCDQNICGVFTSDWNGGQPTLTYLRATNSEDPITVATPHKKSIIFSKTSIEGGKDFYMWLPAGTYTDAQITVHNFDGTTCTKSFSASASGHPEFVINRNTIHTINIGSNLIFE